MTDDLLGRHRAVLPDWLALYYDEPLEITHGEGRHVWDAQGNRYLDFFGGILTTMTAHALPEVTKAVTEQAGRIIHSSTLYLNRPMVDLAERIAWRNAACMFGSDTTAIGRPAEGCAG